MSKSNKFITKMFPNYLALVGSGIVFGSILSDKIVKNGNSISLIIGDILMIIGGIIIIRNKSLGKK